MKIRPWEIMGSLLGAGVLAYLAAYPAITTRLIDFPVYYQAGQKALSHATVYDVVGHFQYKYSPWVAWLFGSAFKSYSVYEAATLTRTLNLVVIVGNFLVWAWAYARAFPLQRWSHPITLGLFAFAFFLGAIKLELQLGQVNFIPISLMTAFCLSYPLRGENRSWLRLLTSGAILSFAIQTKLFACVLLMLPLLQRDIRFLSTFIVVFLVLLWTPLWLIHGSQLAHSEILAWARSLFASTGVLLEHETNFSWLGTLSRILGAESLAAKIVWLITGAGMAVLWARSSYHPASPDRLRYQSLCFGVAVVLLFNPLVWSYWVWFLGPLCVVALDRIDKKPSLVFAFLAVWLSFHIQSAHLNWVYGLLPAVAFLIFSGLRLITPPQRVLN